MKKWIAGFIALVLTVGFCCCASEGPVTTGTTGAAETTDAAVPSGTDGSPTAGKQSESPTEETEPSTAVGIEDLKAGDKFTFGS